MDGELILLLMLLDNDDDGSGERHMEEVTVVLVIFRNISPNLSMLYFLMSWLRKALTALASLL